MNLRCSENRNQAMTLLEVFVVVFILAVLVALLLPEVARPTNCGFRGSCSNNLKEIAICYAVWAGDNNDKFPSQISVTNGGALEDVQAGNIWKAYQVMSNELSTAKILYCPADSTRGSYATNFSEDMKDKISYFMSPDASQHDPQSLLGGDDNFFVNGSTIKSGMVLMASNPPIEWDSNRHISDEKVAWFFKKNTRFGFIGTADGVVQQVNSETRAGGTNDLKGIFNQTSLATNRLGIP
ncbi:MAG TPA: hypothetical protein VK742_12515 [Candidatus Sulfotelmatobacter sp.]|jgi:competence protein ComGC|nr:hypothetical protein [Candidatus Sulfotelmatobacter sp.]